MELDNQVTVLIPTSPIPRHPSTNLIEECVGAIRFYFPTAKVIIMADGVRPALDHRREQYAGYLAALAELCFGPGLKLGNTDLKIFSEHSQQAVMAAHTLHHYVTTPLMMFVEHDAMLRQDPAINFSAIFDLLLHNIANVVRLYSWSDIWHEHQHLMRGEFVHEGARFVKTVQYSQWPLVSRTDYHKKILKEHFRPGQKAMIETVMYSPVVEHPWEGHRVVIYQDGQITFTHRDGRTDEQTGVRDPGDW